MRIIVSLSHLAKLSTVLDPEEAERAARHAATLAPYDWADFNGAPLAVRGYVDWVTQRLLADVRPVADAVAAAAVAKTAEVAIRPHGRCSQ